MIEYQPTIGPDQEGASVTPLSDRDRAIALARLAEQEFHRTRAFMGRPLDQVIQYIEAAKAAGVDPLLDERGYRING